MTIKPTDATLAYSCDRQTKGESKCQRWCGDCLASQALKDARKAIQERYTGQGATAQKGAPNPYRAGSDAAKWWQEGNDAIQPGEPSVVQPPQAFYLGGPYPDGTYAVCDVFTGRILQKFDPQQAQQASAQPTQAAKDVQPRLTVRLTSFPESNGKRNWTALLVRVDPWDGLIGNCGGITVDRGELWNRVAYEAERARFLIGERDTEPHILDYGDDMETPDKWPGETRGGWPKRLDRASNTGQEKS